MAQRSPYEGLITLMVGNQVGRHILQGFSSTRNMHWFVLQWISTFWSQKELFFAVSYRNPDHKFCRISRIFSKVWASPCTKKERKSICYDVNGEHTSRFKQNDKISIDSSWNKWYCSWFKRKYLLSEGSGLADPITGSRSNWKILNIPNLSYKQ